MTRLVCVPSEPWHAVELVARMDPDVLVDFGDADPILTIRRNIERSVYARTALGLDDAPLAIGGMVLDDDIGRVWMVSQPDLERHKQFFLREGRTQIAAMRARASRLTVLIACSYPKSLRWVARLGFTTGPEIVIRGVPVREAWL